jgi:hypothetical protein
VQQLLEALNKAELAGAPATKLKIQQRQFNQAIQALTLTHSRSPSGTSQPAFNKARKIIRVLNNIQPKPKLGIEN